MQIDDILQTNPSKIAYISSETENIRLKWQQAKEEYEHTEAKFVMILKAKKPETKATELKYYIKEDDGLYKKRLDILLLESTYRKKSLEIEALTEELQAAKMLARLRISEWTQTGDFNEEGRVL